jgi:hypothetical protein
VKKTRELEESDDSEESEPEDSYQKRIEAEKKSQMELIQKKKDAERLVIER